MSKTKVGTIKLPAQSGAYGWGEHAVVVFEDHMNIYVSVEPANNFSTYIELRIERYVNGKWTQIERKVGHVSGWTAGCYCESEPWHTQFNNYTYKNTPIRLIANSLRDDKVTRYSEVSIKWTR